MFFLRAVGVPHFEADPTTNLADLVTLLGSSVQTVMGWVTTVANTIVSTPLLLLTTIFLVIGGAIGLFSRLLRK